MDKNYNIAMSYKTKPITAEEYSRLRNTVNSACRHYILGRTCIFGRQNEFNFEAKYHDFGYSASSFDKFVRFAKAIDKLHLISAELAVNIIEERVRISMENTLFLARKKTSEIFRIVEQISDKNVNVNEVFPMPASKRSSAHRKASAATPKIVMQPAIKDMPIYDPDSEVLSLLYTMPSWVIAIEKVFMSTDFGKISQKAQYKLREELVVLVNTAELILNPLKEDG